MKLQKTLLLLPLFTLGGCSTHITSPTQTGAEGDDFSPYITPGRAVAAPNSAESRRPYARRLALQSPSDTTDLNHPYYCPRPHDLWSRLGNSIKLTGYNQRSVAEQMERYLENPDYLLRITDRAAPFLHLLLSEAEAAGIPADFALLPWVESAFDPFAYSTSNAAGMWQFIPVTGQRFGLKQSWWYDGRRDIVAATRAAYSYLALLADHFDGDWLLALAAYNAGEGRVSSAMEVNRQKGRRTDYWSLAALLPEQTLGYIPRLLAVTEIIANPPAYGITLNPLKDEPFLQQVELNSPIDLDLAAQLAQISLQELHQYNPGFNRGSTDPEGPHRLLIPIDKAEAFIEKLASYPPGERIRWSRHTVKEGEQFARIARDYEVSEEALKRANRLSDTTALRAGQELRIPRPQSSKVPQLVRLEQNMAAVQSGTPLQPPLPPIASSVKAKAAAKEGAKERAKEGKPAPVTAAATPLRGKRVHTVGAGETLWSISRQYGVKVAQIGEWNGFGTDRQLRSGEKLTIFVEPVSAPTVPVTTAAANAASPSSGQRVQYTIRKGDSLAAIANRFNVTMAEISEWNRLAGRSIQPGDHLTIFVAELNN